MSAKALNDEDSIPLLVHQGERYRDHDHDDDGDERIRSRRGGTEILNSPPPYLKLDPSHVVVGRRQRVWQTRLIRATLVASILAVGIATGLLLEEVGHLKIVQHAVNDVSLSRDGSVETVDAGKGYNNLSRWVKGPAANTFRGKRSTCRIERNTEPMLRVVGNRESPAGCQVLDDVEYCWHE